MNMCIILNGCRVGAIWILRHNCFQIVFVELKVDQGLKKKSWYTRRIARSHFDCCFPHQETWRL